MFYGKKRRFGRKRITGFTTYYPKERLTQGHFESDYRGDSMHTPHQQMMADLRGYQKAGVRVTVSHQPIWHADGKKY